MQIKTPVKKAFLLAYIKLPFGGFFIISGIKIASTVPFSEKILTDYFFASANWNRE